MFSCTPEGKAPKQGFNFYPLRDPHSAGFRLKIGHWYLSVRYRKAKARLKFPTPRLVITHRYVDPKSLPDWAR